MFAMKIKTKQINKMKENVVFLEVYYYFSSFVFPEPSLYEIIDYSFVDLYSSLI